VFDERMGEVRASEMRRPQISAEKAKSVHVVPISIVCSINDREDLCRRAAGGKGKCEEKGHEKVFLVEWKTNEEKATNNPWN
jgi:hypothetical protein